MGKGGRRWRTKKPRSPKVNEQTSLEIIYGKRGEVVVKPVVDLLGNVIKKKDLVLLPPSDPLLPRSRITIMKDHTLEYPDLFLEVFVAPDPTVRDDEARFAQMFARAGCKRAKSVLEADLVVFGGGSDVDPALYNESRHETTHYDRKRDDADMALYLLCVENGIPMLGICRGAQFLHVMNGGKLFQDIDNHYGNHGMTDIKSMQRIEKVSSVHHQSVRSNLAGGMEILAVTAASTKRHKNADTFDIGHQSDIEAFWYRDTCSIGVQGHPEYSGYNFFTKWCLDLVNDLVCINPDIDWFDKNRRIRPELIAERASITLPSTSPVMVTLTDQIKELN